MTHGPNLAQACSYKSNCHWSTATLVHLCVIYSFFHATMADYMACKA